MMWLICYPCLLQHIPKIFNEVKVCLMFFEHLLHNMIPLDPGMVILERACAIREKKNWWMENPGHSVRSGSQLTSLCCQLKHINCRLLPVCFIGRTVWLWILCFISANSSLKFLHTKPLQAAVLPHWNSFCLCSLWIRQVAVIVKGPIWACRN